MLDDKLYGYLTTYGPRFKKKKKKSKNLFWPQTRGLDNCSDRDKNRKSIGISCGITEKAASSLWGWELSESSS